jgi:hypothetical protein
MQDATMSVLEVPAGELVPWTPTTNLLLMTPSVTMGMEVPAWWNRRQMMRGLGLTQRDLHAWGDAGTELMADVLAMVDHVADWWPTRAGPDPEELGEELFPPASPEVEDSPPASPGGDDPFPANPESSEDEMVVISDEEIEAELMDQWNVVDDWEKF